MIPISSDFIERYQKVYEKNPDSRIFAPLAEAYRRMGMLEEARKICAHGVKVHPDFAGGRVAMAKVLIDLSELESAVAHLTEAAKLAPENLLAHQLTGDLWLKLRKPKEALRSFKMVLLLNPNDSRARKVVKKLESLTADEYEDDLFTMQPLVNFEQKDDFLSKQLAVDSSSKSSETAGRLKGMERLISLADAFTARNDMDKAEQTLLRAEKEFGSHPEVIRRLEMIKQRALAHSSDEAEEVATPIVPLPTRKEIALAQKKEVLEALLIKIQSLKQGGFDSLL